MVHKTPECNGKVFPLYEQHNALDQAKISIFQRQSKPMNPKIIHPIYLCHNLTSCIQSGA